MSEEISWEDVSGRDDPKQRYRLYRLSATDEYPYLLGTCETEADVGMAVITMGREGQLADSSLGILDTMGEKGLKWLVNPFVNVGGVVSRVDA